MISDGISVNIPDKLSLKEISAIENKFLLQEIVNLHQNRLKENGDWKIFPLTLQYIAEGRFAVDTEGNVYFDDKRLH